MPLSQILQADFWPSDITSYRLLDGLSGCSYCVELAGQRRFLLRLQPHYLLNLGSNRQFEADLLFGLQLLPFVPSVFYQDEHFLVQHWTEGESPTVWSEPHLLRLADCLQQLHHFSVLHSTEISPLPQIDLIQRIFSLLQQLPSEQHGCWLMKLDQMKPFVESDIQVIGHHDLHLNNLIVQSDGELKLLDWEYAAWSEPALEIAFMLANNPLTEAQQRYFLHHYLKNNKLLEKERLFKQSVALYLPWVTLLNRLWLCVRQHLSSVHGLQQNQKEI
ncbi:hypothetical protein A1D23_11810 [Chelonobacter oris]|uniref:Aminoglycoside phosphotransferase domain-containing protein n=1 Tax=Chelonobacter oris TaxID=505317 RepID=A0A0A3APV6_9PAST|nr:phosphotransferase [Chelonobacter oris]KGQ69792.1 hypothetical protein OA57_09140 [Chelonobacter oris]MDH3001135.1 hypothetical protein [Chelonobacter oris]